MAFDAISIIPKTKEEIVKYTDLGTENYRYQNFNPKGLISYVDDPFQIMRMMFPGKTPAEICRMIMEEEISTGHLLRNQRYTDHFLKRYLKMEKHVFPKGTTIGSFLDHWRDYIPDDRIAIIRSGGNYEIFDPKEGKLLIRRLLLRQYPASSACSLEVK